MARNYFVNGYTDGVFRRFQKLQPFVLHLFVSNNLMNNFLLLPNHQSIGNLIMQPLFAVIEDDHDIAYA